MLKRPFLAAVLLSISPVLSLYAINIRQIEFLAVLRPLVVSLLIGLGIYLIGTLVLRKTKVAALVSCLAIFLFFAFGHIQDPLLKVSLGGKIIGRAIFLGPALLVLVLAASYLAWRHRADVEQIQRGMNILAICIFLVPLFQIGLFQVNRQMERAAARQAETFQFPAGSDRPNIYYIILDTYSRQDELKNRFKIDNSDFIDYLKAKGFYVASCSRSNYSYTPGSIGSALSMDYLYDVIPEPPNSRESNLIYDLVVHNRVRQVFEGNGYRVVSFQIGYSWGNWKDADVFYGDPRLYLTDHFLYPFEHLLIDTTALRVLTRHQVGSSIKQVDDLTHLDTVQSHVQIIRNALSRLKTTPELSGPIFVYAHILVPHAPYVFKPDGSASWENYFDPATGEIRPDVDEVEGYANNVAFIDNQMRLVVDALLADPGKQPVIIIQGDHARDRQNRYPILNAYYFPGQDYSRLYPGITPVNSFRAVFNTLFGADLPFLADTSIRQDLNLPFSRTAIDPALAACDPSGQ